jgi:DNA-binding NtrC family response regulator
MAGQKSANILVVDDDPSLLELLTDTLLAIGYSATPAADGIIALDLLANQKFDLVITDIKMPRMDGLQLLKKIKRYYPTMPVLFITGVATPEIIGQAEPDGFLAKPFRIAHIEQLIEQALTPKHEKASKKKPELLLLDLAGRMDESLTDGLSCGGYAVFQFRDLEEALRELKNNQFTAIVADFSSWLANPTDVLRRIRSHAPTTPIIFNSDALSSVQTEEVVRDFQSVVPVAAPLAAEAIGDALKKVLLVKTV